MKKTLVIGLCLLLVIGLLFLNPVDYYHKMKYRKVLGSVMTENMIEIGEPLGIEKIEIEEIKHLGGNAFEIIMVEGDPIIVTVEKGKSTNTLNFYEFNLVVSISQ